MIPTYSTQFEFSAKSRDRLLDSYFLLSSENNKTKTTGEKKTVLGAAERSRQGQTAELNHTASGGSRKYFRGD